MNTIKVITELSAEDRKRIDDLIGGIAFLSTVIGNALPKQTQQDIIAAATETQQVVQVDAEAINEVCTPITVEALEPVADPEPEVKPVSLAEFQKAVTMAVSKGAEAKKTVKAIINKYALSVSEVPEDKRADVMAELVKI